MNRLSALAIGMGFGVATGVSIDWKLGIALGLMTAVALASSGRRG